MDEPFEGVEPQSWEETATRLQTEKIELRDEVERMRDAILTHREAWQRCNGKRDANARPDDLVLWAALDPEAEKDSAMSASRRKEPS